MDHSKVREKARTLIHFITNDPHISVILKMLAQDLEDALDGKTSNLDGKTSNPST